MTTLIVDSKEPQTMKHLVKILKIPHEVKSMKVGDYGLEKEKRMVCIIERKTIADLLNAVQSKRQRLTKEDYHRFTHQLQELHNFDCEIKCFGIVGLDVAQEDENVFYGALGSVCARAIDVLFWVPNDSLFLKTIYSFIRKVDEGKFRLPPRQKRNQFDSIQFLRDMGLSESRAVFLLKSCVNLQGVANATRQDLEKWVSKQAAKKIYGMFRE